MRIFRVTIKDRGSDLKYLSILTYIFITIAASAQTFYRAPATEMKTGVKDSVWLENPIPDAIMLFDEKKDIVVSEIFSRFPDNISWFPQIQRPTVVIANIIQDQNYDLTIKLQANRIEGNSDVTYKAYFYTDSTETDSVAMTDTFNVSVFSSECAWLQQGTSYGFNPENSLGSGVIEWKAAVDFDLGTKTYQPKAIEFGYLWDGIAKCEIVTFGTQPEDSVLFTPAQNFTVKGGSTEFIKSGFSNNLTGHVAVVFTTTANFMPMDPSGDSKRTWIYSEETGWTRPELISPDYAGAWYIKLLALDVTTGIEETFTAVRSPVLISNYPNPFNNQTVISWNMPEEAHAEIEVINSAGQFVKQIFSGISQKGSSKIVFNAAGLETGIYFTRIRINGKFASSNKMLYLK
jgi:hypothetical protein